MIDLLISGKEPFDFLEYIKQKKSYNIFSRHKLVVLLNFFLI